MGIFLGINAGGTKTDFVITDGTLMPVYSSTAPPCNLKKEGIDSALVLLEDILSGIVASNKININEIAGICAGFAGGGRVNDTENLKLRFQKLIKEKFGLAIPVIITTDALITLEGAFKGGEGAVLIAGTGSIIYAKDNKDIFYRAGGFGRIIGDEGSGYSIGRKGLAAAAKFFDSRGKDNLMAKYLKDEFNISSTEGLIKKVYEENLEPSEFAPHVIAAAAGNDPAAQMIVDEETEELINHIKSVKNYLGSNFKLCLSGGIIATDNYFSRRLKNKIGERFPNIEIILPAHSPEIGAVLLLRKKTGL